MDEKWKAETDARLNAMQSQLATTRRLTGVLAVVALGLAAYVVVGIVRKPSKIVLEGNNSSLTLEPSEIRLQVGPYSTEIGLDGVWIRHKDAKDERVTHLAAGRGDMSTTGQATLMLSAIGEYSDISMIAPGGGQAEVKAGPKSSQVRVASPNDKGVSIESTPEDAKLSGIGTTFFGLGDSGLPVQSAAPEPAPAPAPAPAGKPAPKTAPKPAPKKP